MKKKERSSISKHDEKVNSSGLSRRSFISRSTLASFGALLGTNIVFGSNLPIDFLPIEIEQTDGLPGKRASLTILNNRPWNAETPPHLLDDKVTPNDVFFVRNNGIAPSKVEASKWTLTISGESAMAEKTYSLSDLKSKFTNYTLQLTLECGGNGRSEFSPPAKGNQWSLGAVGCPNWVGVKLKDVLADVGVKADAVYIGYYGADEHLSGDSNKVVISRGVPIAKAMEDESLIAWQMNDSDLPQMNGYPLRLVFGGWPASCSGKWLQKIVIRNKEHDGPKMGGKSYRVPTHAVAPGSVIDEADMKIIESMPVKSLITFPKTGASIKEGQVFEVRGHAWAGDLEVKRVDISIDFGATWTASELMAPVNRLAWQHFSLKILLPEKGYYEIWAKATDEAGASQPMVVPGWNPKGYLNNACHRIAVRRS